ncbi:MAG: fibronectin type III domain-containing protein [Actinobacteria bacterium]|nr:fibronectin type III domain-containing protein [Actinomycetota bacterium]
MGIRKLLAATTAVVMVAGGVSLAVAPTASATAPLTTGVHVANLTDANSGQRFWINFDTTPSAPSAPLNVSASLTGATTAVVTFDSPASAGASAITGYTVTSSPGKVTGTLSGAAGGPVRVTGLAPGTRYTFTVTATNATETSAPSVPSNRVTTSAPIASSYVINCDRDVTVYGKPGDGLEFTFGPACTSDWEMFNLNAPWIPAPTAATADGYLDWAGPGPVFRTDFAGATWIFTGDWYVGVSEWGRPVKTVLQSVDGAGTPLAVGKTVSVLDDDLTLKGSTAYRIIYGGVPTPQKAQIAVPAGGRVAVGDVLVLAAKPVKTNAGVTVRWSPAKASQGICSVSTVRGRSVATMLKPGTCTVVGKAAAPSSAYSAYQATRTYRVR